MTPEEVAARLRTHDDALRGLGLRSLVLFGPLARGEDGGQSDLDLLYEFDEGGATLDGLLGLRSLLEEVFHRDVDLVSQKYLSPILQRHIGDDLVPVYGPESRPTP